MIGSRGKDAKISEPIHNSDVDFVLVGITACWGSLFSNQASEKFNCPRQFDAKTAKPLQVAAVTGGGALCRPCVQPENHRTQTQNCARALALKTRVRRFCV